MNRVILTGRLTNNIFLKETSANIKVANFSIAVNESATKTIYVNCTAWDKTAILLERYLSKGSFILIEGKLDKNKYTAEDGDLVDNMIVVVERVEFLEPKSKLSTK